MTPKQRAQFDELIRDMAEADGITEAEATRRIQTALTGEAGPVRRVWPPQHAPSDGAS